MRFAASIALAGALLAIGPAVPAAGMPDGPCRVAVCGATLTVDEAPMRWASIELFYPENEEVSVTLSVGGRTLRPASSGGANSCRRSYRGLGIVATVRVCGSETPVRIRSKRVREGMVDLVVAYQAVPTLADEGEVKQLGGV